MEQTDGLSLAALIVALVALVNTVSQVLQQYVATADGYRRCNASVMGEWARFTRRRFKWRELRFETVFATPVIFLEVAYELRDVKSSNASITVLDGSEEMSQWPGMTINRDETGLHTPSWSIFGLLETHHPHRGDSELNNERDPGRLGQLFIRATSSLLASNMGLRTSSFQSLSTKDRFARMDSDSNSLQLENESVTWIPLLRSLHGYSSSLRLGGLSVFQDASSGSLRHGRVLVPAVRLRKQSWDFMPSEVMKPYAVTTVRDLAVMVQLLGLQWTSFKPEEGIIRAEGPGIAVSSTEVRSLGTLVNFSKTDDRIENRRQFHGVVFSPMEGAAALGFGIINSDLLGECYEVYSLEDCYATISRLGNLDDELSGIPHSVLETIMTELFGILTPVLRPVSTGITFLVRPSIVITGELVSLRGCLEEFGNELDKFPKSSPLLEIMREGAPFVVIIRKYCRSLLDKSNSRHVLGTHLLAYRNYNDPTVLALLDHMHLAWRHTTSWLSRHHYNCRRVLREHIRAQMEFSNQINTIRGQNPLRWPEALSEARTGLMALYFGPLLERIISGLERHLNKPEIVEIWMALLFRGICWHAIHHFDDKVVAVPPRYHDSNFPVYIA